MPRYEFVVRASEDWLPRASFFAVDWLRGGHIAARCDALTSSRDTVIMRSLLPLLAIFRVSTT